MQIISGGQTGVDRAALDAAMKLGLDAGGWCPRGRVAEDGPIDPRYPLSETSSDSYEERTAWNVRDSDGTLVVIAGEADPGTTYTISVANQLKRPLRIVDLDKGADSEAVFDWIARKRITTLNVAGPRESSVPGIFDRALPFLSELFRRFQPR